MAGNWIRMVTAQTPTNIAVIKYWGKRDENLILPVNDSISVTLDPEHLCTTTTVAVSPSFDQDRMWLNGKEISLSGGRYQNCLREIRARAADFEDKEKGIKIAKEDWQKLRVHIASYNNFPTAAGLASSAAGFACLVYALAKLMNAKEDQSQLSAIARQGSGSACRSLYGGFVKWIMGKEENGSDSLAVQLVDEKHWDDLVIIIAVVSSRQKETSSTTGMRDSVETSLLLQHREKEVVPKRVVKMEEAIQNRDFASFAQLTCADSNQFHAVCLDTCPPIFYMNDTSHRIISCVEKWNQSEGTPQVAYTFDAGPNAVLIARNRKTAALLLQRLLYFFPPSSDTDMSSYVLGDKSILKDAGQRGAATSMATLSFNAARFRTPPPQSLRPKLNFPSFIKPANVLSQNLPGKKLLQKFRANSVSESSVSTQKGAEIEEDEDEQEEEEDYDDPTAELSYLDPETDPESITEWELDFCSRPILDIRGKKLWELVVCDDSLSLQYTKYFPNNVINSITLKDAIESISEELGLPLPEKVRFFRSQMQTIITKSCKELGIKPIPSKRCVSLLLWLEERYETVYTRHPGFQKGSKPLLALDNPFPMELPENLFGEKWAFVQLPYSAVREEISSMKTRYVFGASLDLDLLGIEIDDKTLIPGLAVTSSRAKPLAAWMNGLEVCAVEADTTKACLILSVGISTRYIYATYRKTPVTTSEAEAWESAKKSCGGLHFLAVQEDLDSDDCVGFWLLLDLPPPPV